MAYQHPQVALYPFHPHMWQFSGSMAGKDYAHAYQASSPQPPIDQMADLKQKWAEGRQLSQQATADQWAIEDRNAQQRAQKEAWEEQKKNNDAARQAQLGRSKALQSLAGGLFGSGGNFLGGSGGFGGAPRNIDLYSSSGQRIGGSFGPFGRSLLS